MTTSVFQIAPHVCPKITQIQWCAWVKLFQVDLLHHLFFYSSNPRVGRQRHFRSLSINYFLSDILRWINTSSRQSQVVMRYDCFLLLFYWRNCLFRISTIESADRLLIIGSTLATYSAFRLLKRALELDKPVLLLNVGPTRADDLTKVEKIEIASGDVLPDVARNILWV